jgi:2-dehydro-3-deoxygluconokinase
VTTEVTTPQVPYVVTFGETMALFRTERPGPLAHAGIAALGIGGAESNVAIGLKRLGVQAVWCSRIGADPLGELVRREIQGEGVVVYATEDPVAPTGLMVKEQRTSSVQRVVYYRAGSAASRIAPDDIPQALIARSAVLHVTGITPALSDQAAATWRDVIGAARTAGVAVSLDLNYRSALWSAQAAERVYRDVLPTVDILFAGDDEAAIALGLDPAAAAVGPEELARRLAAMGPAQVVIKRGADGAHALIDGVHIAQPPVRIDPVDTVGAGDAFVAGYLAEFVRGLPAVERLRTAVLAGAFVCLTPGDWEGLPRRSELGILHARESVLR